MIERVHHIAFIVGDLQLATNIFEHTFGVEPDRLETMSGDFHLEVAVYDFGGPLLEFISPTTETGWVYEYWAEHGDGFFHIAFEVPDIRAAVEDLRARGKDVDGPHQGLDWQVATIEDDEGFVTMQVVEDVRSR